MNTRRILALDTEDDSEGTPTIINFYDGERHTTFARTRTLRHIQLDAWNWLTAQAPALVWACNTEYDLINLCGPWVGKMVTLNYRGEAGLIRASWRDSAIQFYDTIRHWPMSVEQMGRYLGLPKMERDYRSVAYCRRDTEIVFRFVETMMQRYEVLGLKLKSTLPGMALQLFQSQFFGRPWPVVDPQVRTWFREGYFGGRVEIYRLGPIPGPIHHYDVNSLFPSVMKTGTFPDLEAPWTTTRTPDWRQEGMATVTALVPRMIYPPLPMRSATELVYPCGVLTGTWTYPEIRAALARGVRIVSVARAVEYRPMASPFSGYVDFCYGERQRSATMLDNVFWKLMMNSLYGKFGQGDGLTMIYQDREMTLASTAKQANVIWAAYVTALGRVHLLERCLERARVCYYTDTDSVFTPYALPTSAALGDLKWEGTAGSMQAFGNKLYVLDDYETAGAMIPRIIKAKGIPADAQSDFIRTGRAIFRKPVRYRESRRSFATANVWLDVEKEREKVYTKRRALGHGRTEPWEWAAYQRAAADGTLDGQLPGDRLAMPG